VCRPRRHAIGPDTTAESLGRASGDIMRWMASLQDTFVPFGFARAHARGLSQDVTKLAIDLASFHNLNTDEVVQAINSALVGSHRAVLRFGVVINQTALSAELLKMGIEGGVAAATEQQKVLARLAIIMRMTKDAQGDAARTAGSFANRMRTLKARIGDAMEEIGQQFLPVATKMVEAITANISRVKAFIVTLIQMGENLYWAN
jgi:hypothetical protein